MPISIGAKDYVYSLATSGERTVSVYVKSWGEKAYFTFGNFLRLLALTTIDVNGPVIVGLMKLMQRSQQTVEKHGTYSTAQEEVSPTQKETKAMQGTR